MHQRIINYVDNSDQCSIGNNAPSHVIDQLMPLPSSQGSDMCRIPIKETQREWDMDTPYVQRPPTPHPQSVSLESPTTAYTFMTLAECHNLESNCSTRYDTLTGSSQSVDEDLCSLSSACISGDNEITCMENKDTVEATQTLREAEEPTHFNNGRDNDINDTKIDIHSPEVNLFSLREESGPHSFLLDNVKGEKEDSGIATWSYEGYLSGNSMYCHK